MGLKITQEMDFIKRKIAEQYTRKYVKCRLQVKWYRFTGDVEVEAQIKNAQCPVQTELLNHF